MTTKADVATLALQHLGVLAAGETASAEDAALVEDIVDGVHEGLVGKGLADWDVDDVPDAVKLAVRNIVAYQSAESFTIGSMRVAALRNEAFEAEREIRRQQQTTPTDEPVRAVYF